MSNLLVFRTTDGFFTYKPQSFHISLHFVSNSEINSVPLSYKSFLCRPNSSQLKLYLKIADINFSYFAKIPPWLEVVGGKLSRTHRVKELKNKIHTTVRRNLEKIIEVKTFLKMSIGFKCQGPKVEPRFCSFLGVFILVQPVQIKKNK